MHYQRKPQYAYPGPDDVLRHTLPNGITLLVRENFASPSVVVHGYLEAGAEDEPRAQLGLASFTADVMERGTARRTFDQLYEEVESVGAAFGISAGTHLTNFGGKGLAEHLPLLLDVIADCLRYPTFAPTQVEKARADILTSLQERVHDTRRMAALNFSALAYPEAHPYHWSLLGYPETILDIPRDALADFHRRYFSPQGMTLAVVGAVQAQEAADIIAQTFDDWTATRPARPPMPDVPPIVGRREQRIAIPDKTQSNLVMGWPGPARRHADFIPCHIANTILGVFGMYGRLGQSVRTSNGLAYYVYSKIDGGYGPGAWRVIAGVNPANVDQALDLILAELKRMRETFVPKDELQDSQSFLTGSLPLQLETNEGVAQALTNIERYQLGLDYLQRYQEMIASITPIQIREMARKWLDPENFALSIAEPEA